MGVWDNFDSQFAAALERKEAKKAPPITISLQEITAKIKKRIIGQDAAVDMMTEMMYLRARQQRVGKPRGVYLLCGPSGVGKSEYCKALAECFYNDPKAIVTIDCAQISPRDEELVSLLGMDPGFVKSSPGQLVAGVTPHQEKGCVIAYEEFEKAAPNKDAPLGKVLLRMADEAKVYSKYYQEDIDISKCGIILTSNIKYKELVALSRTTSSLKALTEQAKEVLRDVYAPEFLKRLNGIVVFQIPGVEAMGQIIQGAVDKFVGIYKLNVIDIAQGGYDLVAEGAEFGSKTSPREAVQWLEEKVNSVFDDAAFNRNIKNIILDYDGENVIVHDADDPANAYMFEDEKADDEIEADKPQLIAPPAPKALAAPAVRPSPSIPELPQETEDNTFDDEGFPQVSDAAETMPDARPIRRRPFGLGGMIDDLEDVAAH